MFSKFEGGNSAFKSDLNLLTCLRFPMATVKVRKDAVTCYHHSYTNHLLSSAHRPKSKKFYFHFNKVLNFAFRLTGEMCKFLFQRFPRIILIQYCIIVYLTICSIFFLYFMSTSFLYSGLINIAA